MSEIKRIIKNNLRIISGVFFLLLGVATFWIPFFVISHVFLFAGAYLLSPFIPVLEKFIDWLRKKDKNNRFEKTEKKIDTFFEEVKEDK